MYTQFFGLSELPFNLTPDSRFLFLSKRHQEAMSALLFGVRQHKGFTCLTGEIGSGKTTLVRALLGHLDKSTTHIAMILNSCLTDLELLKTINEEFGLPARSNSKKELLDHLNRFLVEQFQRHNDVLLIIDEAQNLEPGTLEQVRMISNLETETDKLIQIVLVGQPELRQTLNLPQLEQLNQRIMVRYHMTNLVEKEVPEYIQHRLRVAKAQVAIEFTPQALRMLFHHSKGVPRRINVICDRCLLMGYVQGRYDIDGEMIEEAVKEIKGEGGEAAVAPGAAAPPREKATLGERLGQMTMAAMLIAIVAGGVWLGVIVKQMNPRPERGWVEPVQAAGEPRLAPPALPAPDAEPGVGGEPGQAAAAADANDADTAAQESVPSLENLLETIEEDKPAPAPQATPEAGTEETAGETAPGEGETGAEAPPPIAPPPAQAPWTLDGHAVVRVLEAEHTEAAAYLTLLAAWNIEVDLETFATAPAGEIARYDLPAMVSQLDFLSYDTTSLTDALRFDLPMIAMLGDAAGDEPARAVTIRRMEGGLLTVADPLQGRSIINRDDLESQIRELVILYRDPHGWTGMQRGAEGEPVVALQERLAELSLLDGEADGKYGPRLGEALRQFQRENNLPEFGLRISPMTALMLCAQIDTTRPRLFS